VVSHCIATQSPDLSPLQNFYLRWHMGGLEYQKKIEIQKVAGSIPDGITEFWSDIIVSAAL